MGRPLFSAAARDSAPAVRVEPEPVYPTYGKWTQWNAFDPDSDEFFESDDAVYEAFVDPADLQPREEGSTSSRSASPTVVTAGHTDVGVVVLQDDVSDVSSGSSEGTASGRESPMEGVSQEEERVETSASPTEDYVPVVVRVPVNQRADSPAGELTRTRGLYDGREPAHVYRPGEDVSHFSNMYNFALQSRGTPEARSPTIDRTTTTRTSDIIPIFVHGPHEQPSSPPATPRRPPSTPRVLRTPFSPLTPSPPPTVTPRLYHWSGPSVSIPTSPSPAPILRNPSARMSLAHIAPTPVQARHIRI
ncbi:hypothetical protein OE88DRAFT_1737809 [Heliocybe sulcata]|uniref:Uncharacterized protein n=1 Tax=Heliocybe sulcata TaxID=5364 RepID=A0A5C3MU63_9AGAM|nr:hypothetical protein OE88DRAFT_1737809 [Heliocybe sulcata]